MPTPGSPASPEPTTWRLWVAPIVWAAHFLTIYGVAALACERQGRAGWYAPSAVPWWVGATTLLACAVLVWTLVAALRAGRDRRPESESSSRSFVDWLAAALATLVLVAVLWETLALVWVPVCG